MDGAEKPVFVPPRKRSSKPISKSSTENLSMIEVNSNLDAVLQPCTKIDPRANRKLHQQILIPSHIKKCSNEKINYNSQINNSISPCKPPITYQSNSPKSNNEKKSDDSYLISEILDSTRINDESYPEVDITSERSALNSQSSLDSCGGRFVTMTGTVKRGKKKGQTMDMKVQMSREELDELEHSIMSQQIEENDRCFFGIRKGPHILTLSLILVPFVLIVSAGHSFYMGTMTWYNMLVYFSEKKTVLHKIAISPLLIISYPFVITLFTLGLGIYAAFLQISWHFDNWKIEVQDWEKGFYGWLCGVINLEDCSPYEVVILTEVLPSSENAKQEKHQMADTAL